MQTEVLRVRNDTNVQLLAGAIAKVMAKKNVGCEVTCIGAAAVNQAVKGIAIARSMVATTGYDLVMRPAFETIKLNQKDGGKEEVTAIRFILLLM